MSTEQMVAAAVLAERKRIADRLCAMSLDATLDPAVRGSLESLSKQCRAGQL